MNLNANEALVLEAVKNSIANGDDLDGWGYSDDVWPYCRGMNKHQVAGYLGSLTAKGAIENYHDGGFDYVRVA